MFTNTHLMRAMAACSVATSLTVSAQIAAQETSMETTVVTATRTEQDFSSVLAAVSVFDRNDIERIQAIDIFDLLSRAAGVSLLRTGGRGSATSLLLRGNQSDHSLFLIDGVRIGSATLGSAALSAISLSNVERIEIIRGPKSALWGADAIGGVVNIITRRGREGRELAIKSSFGSNNTSQNTVFASLNGDSVGFDVTANMFHTDGIDNTESKAGASADKDAFRNNSLALNYRQTFNEMLKLKVSYNYNDGESEYDSACGDRVTFAPVDCFIFSTNKVDALSARLDFNASDVYTTAFMLGRSRDESNNLADNVDLSTTFNGGSFDTEKTEATWLNVFSLGAHEVSAGLDYQKDEVTGTTEYDVSSRDNKAAFVQLQSDFGRFDTLIGARNDDNEQFGSHTTASVQVGFELNDELRLVASYAEGFKPPTFNDLYFPNFGDPTFNPEESQSVELTLKGLYSGASFYVSAFQNDIENLIQFNSNTFETDQTAEAQISGIEFEVSTELYGVEVALSGAYLEPENKANGLLLRRRAEKTVSLDVDRRWSKFGLGMSVLAESERFDDPGNFTALSGYGLIDLRAYYQINEQFKIEARVDNIADKQYTTALDFSLGRYLSLGREAFITFVYTPTR
ncbi:MAG: TonB-dependent receptor [Pseudomonadales bacterium]